jgi:hypothetical protein
MDRDRKMGWREAAAKNKKEYWAGCNEVLG